MKWPKETSVFSLANVVEKLATSTEPETQGTTARNARNTTLIPVVRVCMRPPQTTPATLTVARNAIAVTETPTFHPSATGRDFANAVATAPVAAGRTTRNRLHP